MNESIIGIHNANLTTEDLPKYYFYLKPKLSYKEIVKILNQHHGFNWSVRHFQKYCHEKGWSRICFLSQMDVNEMVANELKRSTSNVGYRQMRDYVSLRYNVDIPKEKVRIALLHTDPEGVALRSRRILRRRVYINKGPFHVVHIDGNDKLKHWGLCIHGAIDGFSRKILWLSCNSTNKDPVVIANLFISCIKKFKMTPKIIRADRGTENVHIERLQQWITGDDNCFKYGKSTRNQRIEALWSRLMKFILAWWIDFFQNMEYLGLLDISSNIDEALIQFCFLPVIQAELNEFIKTWNLRRVRKSGHSPAGKPDMLFHFPHTVGVFNEGINVTNDDINIACDIFGLQSLPVINNEDLYELLKYFVAAHNIPIHNNAEDALDLFIRLKELLEIEGI